MDGVWIAGSGPGFVDESPQHMFASLTARNSLVASYRPGPIGGARGGPLCCDAAVVGRL